ncbi:MAG: AAA family ATPase [Candidatus Yanofskybacteria bacterium]|nr:AAA family ATPase [Candidatus Yanofskybacteria bacterium]
MDALVGKFLEHLKLPAQKAERPFIVGIIGNIGSGKTTVAKCLSSEFPGSVVVQTNSARYILKEAGLGWGDLTRELADKVARHLVEQGYAIILDGGTAEAPVREQLARVAAAAGVPLMFVRVRCETETCILRTKRAYEDHTWQSSFDHFRVGTAEQMVANVRERAKIHHTLESRTIAGLVAEIDANIPPDHLCHQIPGVAEKIRAKLVAS